ncbi:hypothetical protein OUZ56_008425 [Daphnia magna]|uniref:Uncharacterized protein n=1 Tax=Daphnia magna TaxID=35525 RepID=A0ABR0ACX4_9CRUS|nr:hypothetical protein OUZ56_008425 [Daphnia magna]
MQQAMRTQIGTDPIRQFPKRLSNLAGGEDHCDVAVGKLPENSLEMTHRVKRKTPCYETPPPKKKEDK